MSNENKTDKTPDARKQSLYFAEPLIADLKAEAARLDRSLSWVVAKCVKLALPELHKMPSVSDEDA